MSEVINDEPFNPKRIFNELIKRCKQIRLYKIRCIVDESWVGIAPFDIVIKNGIYTCSVLAYSKRDAFLEVTNKLPVIKFISSQDESED